MVADRWNRMMDGSGGMNGGGLLLMFLVGLLLVVLVGAVVYVALRVAGTHPAPVGPTASAAPAPREVLDLRLARGEISPEEYAAVRPLLDP